MSAIDWAVFLAFLVFVVADGIRRGRGTTSLEGYFAGGRSISWWAAGLSIMATQASAITVIGTTGQGHDSGMEFIQIYFGLAFAMVLLSIFFVPLYRKNPILTAYQYLEGRFGPGTRTLASLIFLLSRCLAFGVVLYTPGVVLSALLGLDVVPTVLIIGGLTTVYTMLGGVKAVIATDVKQMVVILGGLLLILILLLVEVVPEFGFVGSLEVLGAAGKLNAVELTPDPSKGFFNDKYNFWSGMIGGLFLMLSYFGCDQSQVQRILTNKNADDSRRALLLSAFAKVPMQAVVLFIGVLLYLFYVQNGSPLLFNPAHVEKAKSVPAVAAIQVEHEAAQNTRRELAVKIAHGGATAADAEAYRAVVAKVQKLRQDARRAVALADRGDLSDAAKQAIETPGDHNYIFPRYLLEEVPPVILGLLMAAIFAAMMSSADSALNALTSSSIVDIHRRWFRPDATEAQSLFASRVMTCFWGVAATGAALMFQGKGSVIEVVNKVGSFFYGSLLGVFVLGMVLPRAGRHAGFFGLIGGMTAVLTTHFTLQVEYLWYNVIGCVGVLIVGSIAALFDTQVPRTTP